MFSVTDTQRAVSHYGFADEYAFQQEKALKEWRNRGESDLLRSSLVSGASGVAPQCIGIINCISTNVTTHTSGTTFNQSMLDGLLALAWENGNGQAVSDVFVGSALKRRISQFSGRSGTQFVVPLEEQRLVTTTAGYVSDFGDLTVHLHRYMQKSFSGSSDSTGRILGILKEKFRIAYLIKPYSEIFGRRGSTTDAMVTGSLTLESLNEKTSFFADGLLNAQ